ncbi:hypothetical protein BGX38DRAFT_1090368 [Terfezia claveryi]|nr:hypothetical protein BGX38DRAFT_1090368 [Terfezia claveryi]
MGTTSSTLTPGTRSRKTIYYGTFIHSRTITNLDIINQGAIGVDDSGKIAFVERDVESPEKLFSKFPEWVGVRVLQTPKDGFFFPGFIDTHIHASQYPNAGLFGSTTLLDWLTTYTFPTESSFSDLTFAGTVYNRVVNRTLSHGTTTASYYTTIHVPATNLLSKICHKKGQRAFIGRVCMDVNCPDYYGDESVSMAMANTKDTIEYIKSIDPDYRVVSPIVTPRFAVTCSGDMMSELGKLAKEENIPIQTHVSENEGEIEFVKKSFPKSGSYTKVYDDHGLLTPRTILSHAVHLSQEELKLIKSRRTGLSHCPISNSALGSGVARVRDWVDEGVNVGLGTDVSGGYSPSVLEAARQALLVSRVLAQREGVERYKLSVAEVLWFATRGGARVVGLEMKVGGFEVGMEWDAVLVGLGSVDGAGDQGLAIGGVDLFGWQGDWEDRVAKWVYAGDERNNLGVWVGGRLVYEKERKGVERLVRRNGLYH